MTMMYYVTIPNKISRPEINCTSSLNSLSLRMFHFCYCVFVVSHTENASVPQSQFNIFRCQQIIIYSMSTEFKLKILENRVNAEKSKSKCKYTISLYEEMPDQQKIEHEMLGNLFFWCCAHSHTQIQITTTGMLKMILYYSIQLKFYFACGAHIRLHCSLYTPAPFAPLTFVFFHRTTTLSMQNETAVFRQHRIEATNDDPQMRL